MQQGNWSEAPHLAEEIYNLDDALVVAQWLNVFLRKSHVLNPEQDLRSVMSIRLSNFASTPISHIKI
jgi:hypothetical protein